MLIQESKDNKSTHKDMWGFNMVWPTMFISTNEKDYSIIL